IPIDVTNNQVTPGTTPTIPQTPVSGAATGVNARGTAIPLPSLSGSTFGGTMNNLSSTPRLRLAQLVQPVNERGEPEPHGYCLRMGASTIYREQGKRLIAVKFSVDREKRDLAGAVAEAQAKVRPLIPKGYETQWSGEFEEMEKAEARLMWIVPVSLALICVM